MIKMLESSREKCMKEIDDRREKILSLARYLHQHPELSMEEHLAASKIREMLKAEGFEVWNEIEGIPTAVVACKKNGSGPRIGLVAEYDALPNIGHACGHNLIAAMGVGAAIGLAPFLEQYQGEVWLIGAPAEETAQGKGILLEKGVFDHVDLAMMIHPGNVTVPAPTTLASTSLQFDFWGKSSHAASAPEMGVNALDAVIQLFNSVNALRQQTREDARIHGIIPDGGDAANMIPDHASAALIIRANKTDYCHELAEKFKNCARGAALATGTELKISHFEGDCDSLESNEKLVELFRREMAYLNIPEYTEDTSSASTDMGTVSSVIPALHPLLRVNKKPGSVTHHSPAYTELTGSEEVEDATINGAKIMALIGVEILETPSMLDEIKAARRICG